MAEVKSDDIKKLREITSAGMMDCKKALLEFNGDIDKAADALRARGIAKAAKRAEKETSQGRVVSYIHGDGNIGVLLQLNCETDFVAKNKDFESIGKDLCMHIAAMSPLFISAEEVDQSTLDRETAIIEEQLKTEGKKKEQMAKILPGKIKKFYSEICLLEQAFVKDNKLTVSEYLKEHIAKFGENITVGRFTRYQVG
ncbi:MAG: translation elongation factor Ts [Spirochaetales bacterium]|nr:translation elongation factor Ts [Spirochaetales bacterium]